MTTSGRAVVALVVALAYFSDPSFSSEMQAPPGTGGIMQPPSDPEKAVRLEFEEMERRGTPQAYELFVERHPDHPLAAEARRRLEALHGEKPDAAGDH